MTPEQCRAGRALLRWKVLTLAYEAKVAPSTINHFECRVRRTKADRVATIRKALKKGGVHFIGETGVALSEHH